MESYEMRVGCGYRARLFRAVDRCEEISYPKQRKATEGFNTEV